MEKVDRIGTFLGTIQDSAVSLTKKSSFPQSVLKLNTTQKWIDTPEEMTHFKLTEPGYAPWQGQEIMAFLVLFKSTDDFNDATKLMNYEQLQLATGWDGGSFDALADGSLIGKEILFRVEENEYEGKVSLQVSWVDAKDADAIRGLKSLAADDVKALSAKLKMGGLGKSAAAPAKPVAAKPSSKPAPAATTKSAPAPAPAAPAASTPKVETPAPAAPKAPKKKAATPPPPAKPAEEAALPATTTQADAWAYVCEKKGANEDSVVEEAWIDACAEVGGDRDEDKFTPEDWAKVRDIVLKDLAA